MSKNFNMYDSVRFDEMIRLLGNLDDKIVLDIGAGETSVSARVKTKKTISLDGVASLKPDLVCDLNEGKLPLKDGEVDVVIAGEIVEHLFNARKFLEECYRILSPGGALILSTPNMVSLKNRLRSLFGKIPRHACFPIDYPFKEKYDMQKHVNDFTLFTLRDLLEKVGFKVTKASSSGLLLKNKAILSPKFIKASFGEVLVVRAEKV
ncbi:methyltransferase domain-containing protein [Candidatus Woesearchaeota archaeon]|jgi:predicted SAM-dependent methyltransferase|nr:methyltransferase domain-containing protein [Candidatus Woesearchaeota archaeon]MBT6044738.1 methyltransferase domain-containing protein [Candidatus Woesearchaeota archaeon]